MYVEVLENRFQKHISNLLIQDTHK